MAPACCARFSEQPEKPTTRPQLAKRWVMLGLLCATLFGSYYVYDNPAAIQNQLEDYFGQGNASVDDDGTNSDVNSFSFRFNMLYSVYSWPNVILPFFGGYLSDKLGVRLMGVVFVLLITVGQAIFALGLTLDPSTSTPWYVMWVGRVIFGFGGESLSVAQSAMIASWFSGRELALGQAANLAIARIGSVVNDAVSVQIATYFPVYWALWTGLIICVLSSMTGIASYYVDERAEDALRVNLGYKKIRHPSLCASLFCASFWSRKCGGGGEKRQRERDEAEAAEDALLETTEDGVAAIDAPPTEEINIFAARKFPLIFWVLCLSCVTVYIAVLPFNGIASGFIAQKWLANGKPLSQLPDDQKSNVFIQANSIMLTTYLVAGCIAPVMGAVIDRVGYRALLNCVASLLIVGVHAMLAFTDIYPVGPLLLLGLSYAIYASALWPSIAMVIEPEYHATAYGIATSVQNLGLAVAPMVVGTLMPSSNCATYDECVKGYARVETFFIGVGGVGFMSGLLLNWVDCTRKDRIQILNWTDKKVKEFKEQVALDNKSASDEE